MMEPTLPLAIGGRLSRLKNGKESAPNAEEVQVFRKRLPAAQRVNALSLIGVFDDAYRDDRKRVAHADTAAHIKLAMLAPRRKGRHTGLGR
jgi:hypothetical protein